MDHVVCKFNPRDQTCAAKYLALALAAFLILAWTLTAQAQGPCTTPGFGKATNFSVGVNPNTVTTGDFDGDGKLHVWGEAVRISFYCDPTCAAAANDPMVRRRPRAVRVPETRQSQALSQSRKVSAQ